MPEGLTRIRTIHQTCLNVGISSWVPFVPWYVYGVNGRNDGCQTGVNGAAAIIRVLHRVGGVKTCGNSACEQPWMFILLADTIKSVRRLLFGAAWRRYIRQRINNRDKDVDLLSINVRLQAGQHSTVRCENSDKIGKTNGLVYPRGTTAALHIRNLKCHG